VGNVVDAEARLIHFIRIPTPIELEMNTAVLDRSLNNFCTSYPSVSLYVVAHACLRACQLTHVAIGVLC
jgi:hypothetical protein